MIQPAASPEIADPTPVRFSGRPLSPGPCGPKQAGYPRPCHPANGTATGRGPSPAAVCARSTRYTCRPSCRPPGPPAARTAPGRSRSRPIKARGRFGFGPDIAPPGPKRPQPGRAYIGAEGFLRCRAGAPPPRYAPGGRGRRHPHRELEPPREACVVQGFSSNTPLATAPGNGASGGDAGVSPASTRNRLAVSPAGGTPALLKGRAVPRKSGALRCLATSRSGCKSPAMRAASGDEARAWLPGSVLALPARRPGAVARPPLRRGPPPAPR